MTCRLFESIDPATGRPVRGIACSRGAPPPCPFPVDPGPDPAARPDETIPAAFHPGAPFRSARWGAGTVLGRVFSDSNRIAVRFAAGRVVEYDLATLCAAAGRFAPGPDSGPLPFG